MITLGVTNGDLDGTLVDGLTSLRQRIEQRLLFPLGEWSLNPDAGTPSLLGFRGAAQVAAAVLSDTIVDEGGEEVVDVVDVVVEQDSETRTLSYSATVLTVYGSTTLNGQVSKIGILVIPWVHNRFL